MVRHLAGKLLKLSAVGCLCRLWYGIPTFPVGRAIRRVIELEVQSRVWVFLFLVPALAFLICLSWAQTPFRRAVSTCFW